MSPVINLGSLPPDDPIYTGREATVFFRRKPSEPDAPGAEETDASDAVTPDDSLPEQLTNDAAGSPADA